MRFGWEREAFSFLKGKRERDIQNRPGGIWLPCTFSVSILDILAGNLLKGSYLTRGGQSRRLPCTLDFWKEEGITKEGMKSHSHVFTTLDFLCRSLSFSLPLPLTFFPIFTHFHKPIPGEITKSTDFTDLHPPKAGVNDGYSLNRMSFSVTGSSENLCRWHDVNKSIHIWIPEGNLEGIESHF